MTYYDSFKSGQLILPSAFLAHCLEIFGSSDDFFVWLNLLSDKELAPSLIAERMESTLDEVNHAISRLQTNHALKMVLVELDEQMEMSFDVGPAFAKLDQLLEKASAKKKVPSKNQIQEVASAFEAEMGTISPLQLEELRTWIEEDKFEVPLILAALKESALNRKVSLNYIRAILRRWRQDGIRTSKDVEEQKEIFTGKKSSKLDFTVPTDGPWSES